MALEPHYDEKENTVLEKSSTMKMLMKACCLRFFLSKRAC